MERKIIEKGMRKEWWLTGGALPYRVNIGTATRPAGRPASPAPAHVQHTNERLA